LKRGERITPFRRSVLAAVIVAGSAVASIVWLIRARAPTAPPISAEAATQKEAARRLFIGRGLLRQGRAIQAAQELRAVRDRLTKEELVVVAETLAVGGDPRGATEFYGSALKAGAERNATLLGRYAEVAAMSGNGTLALTLLAEATALDPALIRNRLLYARGLANAGQFDAARREGQEILRREPANAEARDLLARLRFARERASPTDSAKQVR
jgi:cytochrome c-type biogenesis protein CcmH/NrfG